MGKKNTIVVSSSDDEDKDFLLNSNFSYSKSKTRPSSIPRTNTQSAKSTRLSGSCSRSRKKSNGFDETSDILYYEVLDIPLPELQGLKTLKIAFHHATKDEVVIHTIRLPKQSTVGDAMNDLKTKIFPLNENIENINDQYWTFHAEEVHNFGEPFLLVIHEGEILKEVKVRIQKKLQVPDELFSKWRFAFFSLGHPEYLQDSDILSSCFQRRDVYGVWEQYLGLEHSDNAPERSDAASQVVGKSRWNTDLIETSSSSSSDSDEDFDDILDVMAINLLMEFENSF